VPQVIEQIGQADDADRRVAGFSLGMRQRLGLAAALLGDPPVLLLDEPANGLDPEGIAWLRGFLRHLAGRGSTVVVSSHVLSEVRQTADDVVIIAQGRLLCQATLGQLEGTATVLVRTPTPEPLAAALAAEPLQVAPGDAPGTLRVTTTDPAVVGSAAFAAGIELHELRREEDELESIFLMLVDDERPTSRDLASPAHPSGPIGTLGVHR
jgi:ABC-2 type transport system ATP-binding protein